MIDRHFFGSAIQIYTIVELQSVVTLDVYDRALVFESALEQVVSVSYTHLTLPTKRIV